MDSIENTIHHFSPAQLRALLLLANSKKGIISSSISGKEVGKVGKALGGVFSSLLRHKVNGESLIIPWGKSATGRGLMWKLNTKLIDQKELKKIISDLLSYGI